MNIRVLMIALSLLLLAVGLGRAAEQRAVADFRIVVEIDPEKNAVMLKCTAGCVWTDLAFACREKEKCSSPVDEYGMTR